MLAFTLRLALPFVLTAACNVPVSATTKGAAVRPVEVAVITLAPTSVTLTRELPGRVSARRVAEVRARVDGIVEARLFTEGSDVAEGQLLYRIEAALYEAELAAARAKLAQAVATRRHAQVIAARDEGLLKSNAISRETRDNSATALQVAQAEVAASRAAVNRAKIDLSYTEVTAPMAGRIGRSAVTEGAYVQRSAATLLATIQELDPVYVDITQSVAELLQLRRKLEAGQLQRGGEASEVTLVLPDGEVYAETGTLLFAEATVDTSTGSVSLRALVPNPRGELLPGMFVRARLDQGTDTDAILVPQRAVIRDPKGQANVLVVGVDDQVQRRKIVAERAIGDAWLVSEGLVAGERVIVEGLQKVRPGAPVVVVTGAQKSALSD